MCNSTEGGNMLQFSFLTLGLAIGYISQLITSESLSAYGDESDPQFLEETRKDRVKIWAEASMALFCLVMVPIIVGTGFKWKIFAEILFLAEPVSFYFLSKGTKNKKIWTVYGIIILFSLIYVYRTDTFFMIVPFLVFMGTVVHSMGDKSLSSSDLADDLYEDTDEEELSEEQTGSTKVVKTKKDPQASKNAPSTVKTDKSSSVISQNGDKTPKQEYIEDEVEVFNFSEKDKKDAEMVINLVLFCLLALSLVAFITMTVKIF